MAVAFLDNFIASYANKPWVIIIDSDDTNSFIYEQQELTLFNNYYGDCRKYRESQMTLELPEYTMYDIRFEYF